jgi:general stress protein YciG
MAMDEDVRQYLASIGRKGGKATGKSKLRGGTDYYSRLGKLSAAVRRRKLSKKGGKK